MTITAQALADTLSGRDLAATPPTRDEAVGWLTARLVVIYGSANRVSLVGFTTIREALVGPDMVLDLVASSNEGLVFRLVSVVESSWPIRVTSFDVTHRNRGVGCHFDCVWENRPSQGIILSADHCQAVLSRQVLCPLCRYVIGTRSHLTGYCPNCARLVLSGQPEHDSTERLSQEPVAGPPGVFRQRPPGFWGADRHWRAADIKQQKHKQGHDDDDETS